MAFCTNCGAQVNGSFCTQCGTAIGSQAAPQAAAPAPAALQPPAAKRRTSPLVWILLALVSLIVVGIVCVAGVGIYVAKNPALVMRKLITAANPDAELVDIDTSAKRITIREKRTGKTTTVSFDDVKRGRISFRDNEGQAATMEIGNAGKLPSWVPSYPGANGQGTFSVHSDQGEGGTFTFQTKDAVGKVLAFYKDSLKAAGFTIDSTVEAEGSSAGGKIEGTDDGNGRHIVVTVGGAPDGSTVVIFFGGKQ